MPDHGLRFVSPGPGSGLVWSDLVWSQGFTPRSQHAHNAPSVKCLAATKLGTCIDALQEQAVGHLMIGQSRRSFCRVFWILESRFWKDGYVSNVQCQSGRSPPSTANHGSGLTSSLSADAIRTLPRLD